MNTLVQSRSLSYDYGNVRYVHDFFQKNGFALLRNFLTPDRVNEWAKISKELLARYGHPIERKVAGKWLSYTVIPGEIIRRRTPEIYRFYRSQAMRQFIQKITSAEKMYTSQHLRSSININYLHTPRQVYRWHFDAEPYTAVLFLTSLKEQDGGAFRARPPRRRDYDARSSPKGSARGEVRPIRHKAGNLVIMDGSICAHSVAPLRRDCDRVTLIMVYPDSLGWHRPPKLDDYLYDGNVIDENFHHDPNFPSS